MSPRVNFDGVDETSFEPIPEGTYIVQIDDAKAVTASTGTEGVECVLRIIEGPHAKRLVWDTLWLTDRAMGMVLGKLNACGYPIPKGEFELEPSALVGRRVEVLIRHEEYEGKPQTRVKAWSQPAASGLPGEPKVASAIDDVPF